MGVTGTLWADRFSLLDNLQGDEILKFILILSQEEL
jgi:hypothetical protein